MMQLINNNNNNDNEDVVLQIEITKALTAYTLETTQF
jgi:hypothetical protein